MSRGMKEVTWVVIKDGAIYCERCEVSTSFPLPMKVSKVVAYLRGIAAAHRECDPLPGEPPARVPEQLDKKAKPSRDPQIGDGT